MQTISKQTNTHIVCRAVRSTSQKNKADERWERAWAIEGVLVNVHLPRKTLTHRIWKEAGQQVLWISGGSVLG